jgi:outer membrane protein OmpA-like peptidoglycan-associated protein
MMQFKPVCALMVFFLAGHCAAADPVAGPAPAAAGAFTGKSGTLGAGTRGNTWTHSLPLEGERWNSYRDFWFDYDSSRIDASDSGKGAEVASYLKQNPSFRLALDGALDDADLSARRINSVREALIAAGVPAYKIHTGAFGDPRLRRERRVEVLFSTSQ